MAISAAAHPVRIEQTNSDNQKILKTVKITVNPPMMIDHCNHTPNQHSLCPKCGIVSSNQPQDKKSILVESENLSLEQQTKQKSNHGEGKKLQRRHSEDIDQIRINSKNAKSSSNAKEKPHHSHENLKPRSLIAPHHNPTTKHIKNSKSNLQRTSSLKNPARKTITLQSSVKSEHNKGDVKRQQGSTVVVNRGATNKIFPFHKTYTIATNQTATKVSELSILYINTKICYITII